jgi:hypothetical protein
LLRENIQKFINKNKFVFSTKLLDKKMTQPERTKKEKKKYMKIQKIHYLNSIKKKKNYKSK